MIQDPVKCLPSLPEGLDLGDLFATLSPDFVDVLGCRPHHLLHPLLLQLLLLSLGGGNPKW